MRQVSCRNCAREGRESWKRPHRKYAEDQLGAALIRPGDSVIVRMKRLVRCFSGQQKGWNRDMKDRPFLSEMAGRVFCCRKTETAHVRVMIKK